MDLHMEGSAPTMDGSQFMAAVMEMLADQKQFMARFVELQRQTVETFQHQPQSVLVQDREYRTEGIAIPKFSGYKGKHAADYIFSANLYFESKNIQYGDAAYQ